MKRLMVLVMPLVVLALPVFADDTKKDATKKAAVFHDISYKQALEMAKKEKKVVMIDFYTDWCGWCTKLDNDTYSKDNVKQVLKDKMVAIKINAEKGADKSVAGKYKVRGYPTMVFVDGDGKEVGRLVGYRDANKFLKDIEKFTK
jgi:thiol:disulfide interchange protein